MLLLNKPLTEREYDTGNYLNDMNCNQKEFLNKYGYDKKEWDTSDNKYKNLKL